MLFDISQLVRGRKDKLELNINADLEKISHMGVEYSLASPVKITGKILRTGNDLELEAKIDFSYHDNCARCLKELVEELEYEIDCLLIDERHADDAAEYESDVFFFKKEEINIEELIEHSLDFNMPMRVLCDEDCKGLCPGCGADLNVESCSCDDNNEVEDDFIDPRFAKLKDMFKE